MAEEALNCIKNAEQKGEAIIASAKAEGERIIASEKERVKKEEELFRMELSIEQEKAKEAARQLAEAKAEVELQTAKNSAEKIVREAGDKKNDAITAILHEIIKG